MALFFIGKTTQFRSIWEQRPKDLKTNEEREAWGKRAFADFGKESSDT
jgi:hypothetical protein